MLLSALILKEPITGKKALGVMMGCSGALILILTSAAHADSRVGEARLLPKGRKNGSWFTVHGASSSARLLPKGRKNGSWFTVHGSRCFF